MILYSFYILLEEIEDSIINKKMDVAKVFIGDFRVREVGHRLFLGGFELTTTRTLDIRNHDFKCNVIGFNAFRVWRLTQQSLCGIAQVNTMKKTLGATWWSIIHRKRDVRC